MEIVRQCEEGVRSFNPSLPTALATDWSRVGMGCWLCQKHCGCESTSPGCFSSGWQTVFWGSRFCSPAEARYAPIEGEATSGAWGMEKCKFFFGMPTFQLCLDHKPLLSMYIGFPRYLHNPQPETAQPKSQNSDVQLPNKVHSW